MQPVLYNHSTCLSAQFLMTFFSYSAKALVLIPHISMQWIHNAVDNLFSCFLGNFDDLLRALIVFVALDYIVSVMCVIVDHNLYNRIGLRDIFKKVLIFIIVGIGHILDSHIFGNNSTLRNTIICFYLYNEGISIIENAAYLGLPIPEPLRICLEQLHNRGNKITRQNDSQKKDDT